ncbi:alpha-ketoglutarate-dependent dioxygenase AlkB [Formosa undariae]|uniref:Alpha-ketoglutarate-dependent dioxygenase AlkB n=1 Tax=Formosa undariae TaxID=1325436 RepID=A0ABV5F387_9FLAO
MSNHPFYKTTLLLETNFFESLSKEIVFETLGKGRFGNTIIKCLDKGIPVVRTTTKFSIPAHYFTVPHLNILNHINKTLEQENQPKTAFNCGLIEIYDENYTKMGYHSDLSLDLKTDSYIGLFSCYKHPETLTDTSIRILRIKDKSTEEEFDIALTHNSFVLFSVEMNAKYSHKIILENPNREALKLADNKWLGITFRTSKTFVKFNNDIPSFKDGTFIELANEVQEIAFYKLRGEENRSLNFTYPEIKYTLSKADFIVPKLN